MARTRSTLKKTLIEKIEELPPEKIAEVEDFVDFLNQREHRHLVHAFARLSEDSFARIWDNPIDAEYDKL